MDNTFFRSATTCCTSELRLFFVRMFSVISVLCELQLWATGCPFGYLPTFNTYQGSLYRTCSYSSECATNGAECVYSPLTASSVCCRTNPSLYNNIINPALYGPKDQLIYIYPYVGFQEFNVTTTAATTAAATTATSVATTPPTTAAITTATVPSTTVSRIVNITATASGSTSRVSLPTILLPVNSVLNAPPQIYQLVVGRYTAGSPSIFVGSVSLICDNGYNVLVDPGIIYRQSELLAGLAVRGLNPSNVHTVVITHGHPDHFGGGSLFPNAQFIFGPYVYRGDQFMFSGLNVAPTVRLSLNSDIWNTPGHTPDSLTVVIRNVPGCGTVAITGDLFISFNDLSNQTIWRALAWDFTVQQQSRNLILCQVNFIIPGHGQLFQVTDEVKRSAGCPPQTLGSPESQNVVAVAARGGGGNSSSGGNVFMQPVYTGSNLPVVNPLTPNENGVPPAPVYLPTPGQIVRPLTSAPPVPPPGAPPPPSGATNAPENMLYLNPKQSQNGVEHNNFKQQKFVFTNQYGNPLGVDDQKFVQYHLQYSKAEQTGNNAYSNKWPIDKT